MDWTKSSYSADSANCVEWRKSTYCHGDGCVEYRVDTEVIQIRDSKDKQGPVLTFTPEEWKAFTLGVKAGEFNL